MSHPHGCVSWNFWRCCKSQKGIVTPSRVCELKCKIAFASAWTAKVTPSRVCELKSIFLLQFYQLLWSHPHGCVSWNAFINQSAFTPRKSHPHGCVSWNEYMVSVTTDDSGSHPHGCVSWNIIILFAIHELLVTPSRVCELKFILHTSQLFSSLSHTLTGVWVEIHLSCRHIIRNGSHPHGCVSWN